MGASPAIYIALCIVYCVAIYFWVQSMNAIMLYCGHSVCISSVSDPIPKMGLVSVQ